MQVITTTELRTRSKDLIKTLQEGRSVGLIHRSKVVAEIKPVYDAKPLTEEGVKRIQEAAKKLNLPKLAYKEREKIYRKHLRQKYGMDLS
ncbi:MAG: hypothetical protein HYS86_05590 [Candidatus Chisholmbacteria bacterium]|nr:hypothetical protein [Candidatus Chisholmbacteria bacterium]